MMVHVVSIVVDSLMLFALCIYKYTGYICYVNMKAIGIALFVVPYVMAGLSMIIINILIILRLSGAYRGMLIHSVESSEQEVSNFLLTYRKLDVRGKHTVIRLILLPLIFCCIIVVVLLYSFISYSSKLDNSAVACVCGAISGPVVNALVWVISDQNVLWDWCAYLTCRAESVSIFNQHHTSDFNGPQSSYGSDNDRSLEFPRGSSASNSRPSIVQLTTTATTATNNQSEASYTEQQQQQQHNNIHSGGVITTNDNDATTSMNPMV